MPSNYHEELSYRLADKKRINRTQTLLYERKSGTRH